MALMVPRRLTIPAHSLPRATVRPVGPVSNFPSARSDGPGRGGRPIAGAFVYWDGVHNGAVVPLSEKTDMEGRARARFTLGVAEGIASLYAAVVNVDSVPFRLEVRAGKIPRPRRRFHTMYLPQVFETFEGSGETVHPDWAIAPWSFPQHIAITPYPNGNANYELPSLFGSHHGVDWEVAAGVTNPVVPAPVIGHLSDPDIVWNPESGELYMYYRQAADRNLIWLIRSADGIRWSAPVLVVSTPNHEILSPAVVRRGQGDWWMWSVNGDREGCSARTAWLEVRRSTDGIVWAPPARIDLAHDGLYPWHVEVQWIPSPRRILGTLQRQAAGELYDTGALSRDQQRRRFVCPEPAAGGRQGRACRVSGYRLSFYVRLRSRRRRPSALGIRGSL